MKLKCNCGHIIVDQADSIPYKGYILPDTELEYFDSASKEIAGFIEAIKSNRRSEWIENKFSEVYPKDLNNESIIFDIIHGRLITKKTFQCEACGRILMEDDRKGDNSIEYKSFYPEGNNSKGLLNRIKE